MDLEARKGDVARGFDAHAGFLMRHSTPSHSQEAWHSGETPMPVFAPSGSPRKGHALWEAPTFLMASRDIQRTNLSQAKLTKAAEEGSQKLPKLGGHGS